MDPEKIETSSQAIGCQKYCLYISSVHKQGGWLGCVLTACLGLMEGKILCTFWQKFPGGSADTFC